MAIAKAKQAPEFSLRALNGSPFTLGDHFSKTPLLLFFFKTTCPVCQFVSPFIERIAHAGANTFGICQTLEPAMAERYTTDYSLTFPILLEQPGYDVSNRYDIDVVPTLFVLDSTGKILTTVESFLRPLPITRDWIGRLN